MKVAAAIAILPFAAAWAPPSRHAATRTCLEAVGAASSFEEDLELTLKIIMDHAARSTTTSKEQMLQQVHDAKEVKEIEQDVLIPYDAAAKLAYEASDKNTDFDEFKVQYLAGAVADVVAKQPVDLSIPYDAAAQVAFLESDRKTPYAEFKANYLEQAVADVTGKQPVDLSIPYDAAAQLAYLDSDRKTPYAEFKASYLEQAVADVIAKQSSED